MPSLSFFAPRNTAANRTQVSLRCTGRLSLWVVIAALPLMAAACPGSSPTSATAANTVPTPKDSADQVLYGVNVDLTNQGAVKGRIHAAVAYMYEDGTRVELERVDVTFLNSTGVKTGSMTSNEATFLMNKSQIALRGQVVVTGDDGRQLHTEQLTFQYGLNKLSSSIAYTLNEKNAQRQSTGTGFESDPQLNKFVRAKTVAPAKTPAVRPPAK